MAAVLQTVRIMRVPAAQLTRRVRLATIRTVRLRQIRAAHTINAAQRHSVLIILALRAAAIPHRNSALTLRRRVLIQRRAAHTRHRRTPHQHLAADRLAAVIPLVAGAEVEAAQDHTAAKWLRILVRLQNKKAHCFKRAFFICEFAWIFFICLKFFLELRSLKFHRWCGVTLS